MTPDYVSLHTTEGHFCSLLKSNVIPFYPLFLNLSKPWSLQFLKRLLLHFKYFSFRHYVFCHNFLPAFFLFLFIPCRLFNFQPVSYKTLTLTFYPVIFPWQRRPLLLYWFNFRLLPIHLYLHYWIKPKSILCVTPPCLLCCRSFVGILSAFNH